jgi:hypothetical protein
MIWKAEVSELDEKSEKTFRIRWYSPVKAAGEPTAAHLTSHELIAPLIGDWPTSRKNQSLTVPCRFTTAVCVILRVTRSRRTDSAPFALFLTP